MPTPRPSSTPTPLPPTATPSITPSPTVTLTPLPPATLQPTPASQLLTLDNITQLEPLFQIVLSGGTLDPAHLAISDDGRWLAIGTAGPAPDGLVELWDLATLQRVKELRGHSNWITALAFSWDGVYLASASRDGSVRVWTAQNGEPVATLSTSNDVVWDVAFSPDGAMLASAASDGNIQLWNPITGKLLQILLGHVGPTRQIEFAPLNVVLPEGCTYLLLSGSEDKSGRIWCLPATPRPDSVEQIVLGGHSGAVTEVHFLPDGLHAITVSRDETLRIWEISSGLQVAVLDTRNRQLAQALIDPTGSWLYAIARDGEMTQWDSLAGRQLASLYAANPEIWSASLSPNGSLLVIGGNAGALQFWDADRGLSLYTRYDAHSDGISDIAFSADGRLLISASFDGTVRIWGVLLGEP